MLRLAAIDIGTNSTRLLIADVSGQDIREVESKLITTRLGEGMGGLLLPEPMERTLAAMADCYKTARALGAVQVTAAATSAVRDAANQKEFLEMAALRVGLAVRVLDGTEEAALSCRGVFAGLSLDPLTTAVLDVGGGSTELVWQSAGQICEVSVQAGAVRMTGAGWNDQQLTAIFAPVLERLKDTPVNRLAGVGGTITTLAAMEQRLVQYDPRRTHGYYLTAAAVNKLYEQMRTLSVEERKKLPGLQPARADIIVAGAAIVRKVLSQTGLPGLIVSESDILYGLILETLK